MRFIHGFIETLAKFAYTFVFPVIRGNLQVVPIEKKINACHLRWFGFIFRRPRTTLFSLSNCHKFKELGEGGYQ